jgi:alkanesulfonate monooxygenase SsuD/methylene tetrahydromethanopterin reductase-like flavin-dependent oxidoreductase (luciferase family)
MRRPDGREVGMNARVQLGIAVPQTFLNAPIDGARLRQFLTRADTLGFHRAWVVEQILGTIPSLEPVTLLTWAAALTERLRLGSAVLLTALRSPLHLAKSLATLDQLSGGRLIVGVGLGGNPKLYPAFGLDAKRRVARFAEGLRLMKQKWTSVGRWRWALASWAPAPSVPTRSPTR